METGKTQKGFVIPDTHILARRSRFKELYDSIKKRVSGSDIVVLNGDIFDFKWSYDDHGKSIIHARQFIEELCDINRNCQIYYILGNHDALPVFIEELKGIDLTNFHWSMTHFHLGDKLSIHGDLPLSGGNIFHRVPVDIENISSMSKNILYEMFLNTRFHKIFDHILPTRKTAKMIIASLEKHAPQMKADIKEIYFGHTHVPENDYEYDGIRFFNTGSGIKRSRFNPIEFEIADD